MAGSVCALGLVDGCRSMGSASSYLKTDGRLLLQGAEVDEVLLYCCLQGGMCMDKRFVSRFGWFVYFFLTLHPKRSKSNTSGLM